MSMTEPLTAIAEAFSPVKELNTQSLRMIASCFKLKLSLASTELSVSSIYALKSMSLKISESKICSSLSK